MNTQVCKIIRKLFIQSLLQSVILSHVFFKFSSSSSILLDIRRSAVIRLDFRGFLLESQFEVSGSFSVENKRTSFFLEQNVNLSFSAWAALTVVLWKREMQKTCSFPRRGRRLHFRTAAHPDWRTFSAGRMRGRCQVHPLCLFYTGYIWKTYALTISRHKWSETEQTLQEN